MGMTIMTEIIIFRTTRTTRMFCDLLKEDMLLFSIIRNVSCTYCWGKCILFLLKTTNNF